MFFFMKLILITSVFSGGSFCKAAKNDKFNIVLFLAHSGAETSSCDPTGLKFLKFKEKARVKHCDGGAKSEDGESVEAHYMSSGSDCESLLKASLFSLISYCRNMIGMTTALACAENNTFTNSLRFQRSAASKRFQRDYQGYKIIKSMPLFFPRTRHAGNKKQFITKPEHTEVFKIRSKRQNSKQKKSATLPLNNFKDPNWDFLGVIATIKMTFFGKLIPENKSPGEDATLEASNLAAVNKEIAEVKQIQGDAAPKEECLFDLVKDTLSGVQESCESGFLVVVVGGNLSEVADPYSNLVQSVKHITENTDDANTIIVVTGLCPTREHSSSAETLIPVYVKGPPLTDLIAQTSELYNIPYAIKNIIADSNVEGNFFTNMRARRGKRDAKSSCSNISRVILYKLLLFILLIYV